MRYRSLGWIMMGGWISLWPLTAHADYLSNARAAMKKGDLKTAQIELRNAIRSDPQNGEAHFWLARVSYELGDPVAAEREAAAARDRGFDPHQAVPLLAQAMLSQNKYNELLATLNPDGKDPLVDASILVSRGYAYVGLKRPEDAQKSFSDAEKTAPNAVEPLLADARFAATRGDLATAQAKIDTALAAQPKSPEALIAKAQLLRAKNDNPGALAILDQLITDQPTVMQAHLDRAGLYLATAKNDAAKADIDVVLKATPGNVQALYLMAVLDTQAKNYKAADAGLEKLSGYLGRIPRAYYLLAVVKEQLGQYAQAEDAAQKYLARAPNDLAAYKVLARIEFVQRRPDRVIETLTKIADSGKPDAEFYDLLGRAYAATNRGAEAVEAFQKAEALAPNDIGLQTRLASVRMSMGEPDAAIGDLEHTLTLAPKLPAIGEALFFAALATGDSAKAADALAKIRAAEGQTEVVGNLEGLYKLSLIDLAGAQKTFADVLQKYPDFVPAKVNLARVLLMQGNQDQAAKLLDEVLAKQPVSEPALTMRLALYRTAKKNADAVALLERAAQAAPNSIRVAITLGNQYIVSGEPQKALDLAIGKKGEAADSAEMISLRASAYLAMGQKKPAAEAYAEMLKLDPNLVGARRQLVSLLIDAGDYEAARATLTAGIAANPRNYQLYEDLVMIDLKTTGLDAAMATAERLQAQDRDFAELHMLKGDIYTASNRPGDAAAAFVEANKTAPSAATVNRAAGALLRAQRVADAQKLLGDWIAAHPDDVQSTEQLAEIAIATSKYDDAVKYLNVILKQRPHDPVALNNLAWVYQQQGDDAKAQPLARQAYVLSPSPQTADTLGWILTTSGQAGEAVPLLRQATSETTTDPRILFHFAVALKDSGNKAEAKKYLETVVAAQGNFKEKVEAQKMLDDLAKGA